MAVATILVIVGWLIARTWFACSAVVVSESMAPALLGPHVVATCPECNQTTKVAIAEDALQNLENGKPVACQNCGTLIPIPPETPINSGDSLWVRRSLALTGPPQRWGLISCQDPMSSENVIAKRLVGLPGETVQIINGDVFINGQIARKSLDQQAATAILVYDAEHEVSIPSPNLPKRWLRSKEKSSESFELRSATKRAPDRLTYHHLRRVDGQMVAGPVVDQLAYNQWLPIRRDSFNTVSDLMLTFHLSRIDGDGCLTVFTAKNLYAVTFDFGKKKIYLESLHHQAGSDEPDSTTIAEASFHPPHGSTPVPVLVSTVDRCLMVVVDQNVVINEPLPESIPSSETPFSLEAAGLDLDISRLRIYRDVYYTRPIGIKARWAFDKPVQLGEGEYFILGDNSRVSEDSRTWPRGPAIHRREIFGRP